MNRSTTATERAGFIDVRVADVSGQKHAQAKGVPADSTVGELIHGLLTRMNLPRNDVSGRPLTYQARLDREGRHLRATEVVGDALQENDRIVLQPNVDAGCR